MGNKGIKFPAFPCTAFPDDPAERRLLGLYPQRQDGLWMQRIKLLGGALSAEQWNILSEICRHNTPLTPLHITTRQDIEFHNISPDKVSGLQKNLADAGFTGLGAGGDSLRNITLCPGNGLCEGQPDLSAIALAVRQTLDNFSDIYSLPRKFKIAFSSCPNACAQPWINDLSFIAEIKNGAITLKVVGAGSLGPHPATGILLKDALPLQNAAAFALAAVRLFNQHGNREKRGKARLRHIRERTGDAVFISMLNEEFETSGKLTVINKPSVTFTDRRYQRAGVLNIPYGHINPEQAEALAHLLIKHNCIARIQNHHRISLFEKETHDVLRSVENDHQLKEFLSGPDIVSCPGTTYCKHALVNTHATENALRQQLPASEKRAVRISGCPNGCAHSSVAEIGLIGRIRKDEHGNSIEGFQVVTGGGMGLTQKLAKNYKSFVSSDQISDSFKP